MTDQQHAVEVTAVRDLQRKAHEYAEQLNAMTRMDWYLGHRDEMLTLQAELARGVPVLLAAVERLERERDGIEAALIAVIDDMREADWHHLSATLNQQVSDALNDKTDKTRRWREFVARGDHDGSDVQP